MALFLLLPALALAGSGKWNPFRKKNPNPEPVVTEAPAPEPEPLPPLPTLAEPLFDGTLPFELDVLPTGLANSSAQGCHACHPSAVEGWRAGPHAGPPSDRLRAAVADTGITACVSCHLPVASQHATEPAWEIQEVRQPRAGFDATLHLEGVTCAACHVREGRVAVGTEEAARGVGPHIVGLAPDLGRPETCAACHQLTWPGANVPLYDTYGEWKRSAWADAGVTCLDCHRSSAAPHAWTSDPSRALSVLLQTESLTVVRGTDPVTVAITLQNTGAGHAYPSGTPFAGLRLQAQLEDPSQLPVGDPLSADLVRTLQEAPPWATVSDTRLGPGESQVHRFEQPIGVSQPAGWWHLVVTLTPTLYGQADDTPSITRRLPLWVE